MADENTRNGNDRFDDDVVEMTRNPRPDDRIVDAVFSGQVPIGHEDLADVAAFATALRDAASATPTPGLELGAVLAHGLSTDKGDLPVTVGSNVAAPASQGSRLPNWRRRKRMLGIALANLGLVAKASFASVAVVAATTGAAAADLLPPTAQDNVAGVVGAVTPFELPTSADRVDDDEAVDTDEAADPDANDHGQLVSDTARNSELEGCERGHEIASAAGGDPDDCVEGDDDLDDDGRPENPGLEGRDNADDRAGENGQEGRDIADAAANGGATFGADEAAESQDAEDGLESQEQPIPDLPESTPDQQTGDDIAENAPDSAPGQDVAANAPPVVEVP